jgi:hypothetical protein
MGGAVPNIEFKAGAVDPYWILAIMNFPSHEQSRETDYAINFASNDLSLASRGLIPLRINRKALSLIVESAKSDGIGGAASEATKRGNIAGCYLLALYQMHQFPQHFKASVSKAIHLVRHYSETTEYSDGAKLPRSASEIRECFHEFKSVAHLWGALRLLQDVPHPKHPGVFASEPWVIYFLGVARELQDFGLEFRPPAPKEQLDTLLNEHEIWRVPDVIEKHSLSLKQPPAWMLDAMSSYKAKERG